MTEELGQSNIRTYFDRYYYIRYVFYVLLFTFFPVVSLYLGHFISPVAL